MKENTEILSLSSDVKWIGILDFDIVTFDVVMETRYGSTYNSFYIDAGHKTIIDTCKEAFWPDYERKLRQLTDPAEIEYVVMNHTEPDHSGSLTKLLKIAPNARVLASGNAIRYLKDMIGGDFPYQIVKDGDSLDIGNKTLRFIGAANLHWPDTIYTYLEEDRILFSCDSFGCHYCDSRMFDDQLGNFDEAFLYYFNVILKPFSKFMRKAVEKVKTLDISMIAPGHGPILRSHWKKYLEWSLQLSEEHLRHPDRQRVYIAYVSAYHKTGLLAEKIAEGLKEAGDIEVIIQDIEMVQFAEMEEKLTHSTGLIVGSPTINQNILLPVYKLFAAVTPIRDRGKLAGGFGSYGWSGEGEKLIRESLRNLKFDYFQDGVFIKFSPTEEEMARCYDYGLAFGRQLLSKAAHAEQ